MKQFLKKKNIEISVKRYLIDALGAMAQGLFCSLLIGTIINTIGNLFHIELLTQPAAVISGTDVLSMETRAFSCLSSEVFATTQTISSPVFSAYLRYR